MNKGGELKKWLSETCQNRGCARWAFQRFGGHNIWLIECLMELFVVVLKWQLDRLKGRGLLLDVDFTSGKISIHDLYREFVELEVKGKFDDETDLKDRKWVYVKNGDLTELESTKWSMLAEVDTTWYTSVS